ncbi:hypothetical protein KA005_35770 [bacterium]|nr:hypothetical protein [bacterium]
MKGSFWIVLYNDDRHSFNVVGTVCSDKMTTSFTAELQKYGFNVHMQAIEYTRQTKEDLIADIKKRLGMILDTRINWLKD